MPTVVLGRVQRNVDGDAAIERDRGQVLIEERLEHDDLVALLEKGDEDRVLSWVAMSGCCADRAFGELGHAYLRLPRS